MDLVLDLLGVLEIDGGDLQQGEIALAFLGRADRAFGGVAGAQAEAADLGGGDIDIVGAGQVVGFRRAQEAEAVLQDFHHALAGDLDFAFGQFLEDGEQHVLLAHGRGVLDLQFLGKGQQIGGFFVLEILQLHRLQAILDSHGTVPETKGGLVSMHGGPMAPGRDHRKRLVLTLYRFAGRRPRVGRVGRSDETVIA